jgi:hypothetical protein
MGPAKSSPIFVSTEDETGLEGARLSHVGAEKMIALPALQGTVSRPFARPSRLQPMSGCATAAPPLRGNRLAITRFGSSS